MTIGNTNTATPAVLNNQVGNMAVQLRNQMDSMKKFITWFNNLALTDVETLFALQQSDAEEMQTMISYMNTLVGCYYGTVQQGGSGGTGAILFNFDNALSILWGGQ